MLNTTFSNDIRQTLDHFRRSVDQLFDNFYGSPADRSSGTRSQGTEWTFSPVLETGWTENELHLRAIVPGVRQNDVNVNLQGNQLVISGERRVPDGFDQNAFTHLTYGKFSTAVTLPAGLDIDKVKCQLHDGVLDIAIPITESMKPRQIPVETGSQHKALSA